MKKLIFSRETQPAIISIDQSKFIGYFDKTPDNYFLRRLDVYQSINSNTCSFCKLGLDFDSKIIDAIYKVSHSVINEILFLIRRLINHFYISLDIKSIGPEDIKYSLPYGELLYVLFEYEGMSYITIIDNHFEGSKQYYIYNTLLKQIKVVPLDRVIRDGKYRILGELIDDKTSYLYNLLTSLDNSCKRIEYLYKNKGSIQINNIKKIGPLLSLENKSDEDFDYKQLVINLNFQSIIDNCSTSYTKYLLNKCRDKVNEILLDGNRILKDIYIYEPGCKIVYYRSIFVKQCALYEIEDIYKLDYLRTTRDSILKELIKKNKKIICTKLNLFNIGIFINTDKNIDLKADRIYIFKLVRGVDGWELHNAGLGNTFRDGSICWGNITEYDISRLYKNPKGLEDLFLLYLSSIFDNQVPNVFLDMGNGKYLTEELELVKNISTTDTLIHHDNIYFINPDSDAKYIYDECGVTYKFA